MTVLQLGVIDFSEKHANIGIITIIFIYLFPSIDIYFNMVSN